MGVKGIDIVMKAKSASKYAMALTMQNNNFQW